MTLRRLPVLLCSLFALTVSRPAFAAVPVNGADRLATTLAASGQLPPVPEGVEELRFGDIYATPIGPRGLELTPRAAALSGKRVRLLGYMVQQGEPAPGVALLSSFPILTHEDEYGLCDDLPAATVFVVVPRYADRAVPHTPGPLVLTGRFETSPREEADGRVSHLRLILDADAGPAAAPADEAASVVAPVASLPATTPSGT